MKILLILIDKTHDAYLETGCSLYAKRLGNYVNTELLTIPVNKATRQRSQEEQKSEEARLILRELKNEDELVLLDEQGSSYSSRQFANFLQQKQNASLKRLVFVVGGPFGFDPSLYQRANHTLSLSKMTFSHQMVRLFFLEQLYRAYTILKGEKYHHD